MLLQKDNNTGRGMVLTHRDQRVVADISSFGVLTRKQLQRLGHFRSTTRANATLLRLVRFNYLNRKYAVAVTARTRAAYVLGPRGSELYGDRGDTGTSDRFRAVSDLFVEHQLLV